MIKKIILHVGMHKTGTSSIQESFALEENQKLLRQNGILYPTTFGNNHSVALYPLFAENPIKYPVLKDININTISKLQKFSIETVKKLTQVASESEEETLFLSAEDFCILEEKELLNLYIVLHQIFCYAEFEILLFTRNPVDYYISLTQTLMITGRMDNFSKKYLLTKSIFKSKIEKFENVFGKENVKVCSIEQATSIEQRNIINYVFDILKFSVIKQDNFKIIRANESLSQIQVEFIDYLINKYPKFIYQNGMEISNPIYQNYDLSGIFNFKWATKYNFPWEDRKKIAESFINDTIWLKENFEIDYVDKIEKISKSNYKSYDIYGEDFLNQIENFYMSIDENLIPLFSEYLDSVLGKIENKVINNKITELIEHQPYKIAQLFWDSTNEFFENNSNKYLSYKLSINQIELHFEKNANIQSIRFDPSNGPIKIELVQLFINNTETEFTSNNSTNMEKDIFVFSDIDPQFIFESNTFIYSVKILYKYFN